MTNQSSETDYDKKFQEDLEKATALSLETLALDQFRRTKLQYSHSDAAVSSTSSNRWAINYRQLLQQHQQQQQQQSQQQNQVYDSDSSQFTCNQRLRPGSFRSESGGGRQSDPQIPIAPPPAVPPRRLSEIHFPLSSAAAIDKSRNDDSIDSGGGGGGGGDLISFTSPTAAQKEQANLNFDKLLEEIQRLNLNTQNHSIPAPFNNATMYGSTPSLISTTNLSSVASQNLQLVPYTATNQQSSQQQHQGQKLTTEQLNKLYNMQPQPPQLPFLRQPSPPYQLLSQPLAHHVHGHHQQYLSLAGQLPPPPPHYSYVTGTAVATNHHSQPPPGPAYGFQMHVFPPQTPSALVAAASANQQQPQQQQIKFPSPPPTLVTAGAAAIASSSSGINYQSNTTGVMNIDKVLVQSVAAQQLLTTQKNSQQMPKSASITSGMSSATASGPGGTQSKTNSSIDIQQQQQNTLSTSSRNSTSSITNSEVIVRRPKKVIGNDDLIDLGHEEDNSRVSVLEAFDPLLSKDWGDDTGM